jgi:DNA-binding CsgD family transcriptional regulator
MTPRQRRALLLRLAGYTYQEVASELGTTRSRAHQLVQLAVQHLGRDFRLVQDEARKGAMARAEAALRRIQRARKLAGRIVRPSQKARGAQGGAARAVPAPVPSVPQDEVPVD